MSIPRHAAATKCLRDAASSSRTGFVNVHAVWNKFDAGKGYILLLLSGSERLIIRYITVLFPVLFPVERKQNPSSARRKLDDRVLHLGMQ
jgi:hypothetical protein